MERSYDCFEIIRAMADTGLPASLSDVAVAALAARSAVMGAFLNVKINAKDIEDRAWIEELLTKGLAIEKKANATERDILQIVNQKLS